MEKHTKKRMLALLMMCVIGSQQYSNIHAAENSKRIMAIVPAMILVAAAYYYGHQNGVHQGRQEERDEIKKALTNQQKS